ncbi:unnamed protein product [Cylicocyclus nassatus]|uniref:Uncharacterized protein n=1 Tax=Cylicocyclus nassatus TaxID=53992 RepID=A0AA36DQ57_CYLNA|nr:unnamed protein product [Cylicocyclus nassatus]
MANLESPTAESYDLTTGKTRFNWNTEDAISVESAPTNKNRSFSIFTKMIAEFLGDFTFVFIGCMQTVVTVASDGESAREVVDTILHATLAHGFAIFILVAALGHISGGHFNPAVTWSVAGAGKMPLWHVPFYWFAQLLGGFCGALYAALVMTKAQLYESHAGATLLSPSNKWWEGLASESVVTFFLCHTVLLTAVDTNKNLLAPLAIGLTLSIDILSTGAITGASMNPARSLGPNIVGQIFINETSLPLHFWDYHYIYWAGPFIGATVATCIYWIFESRQVRLIR